MNDVVSDKSTIEDLEKEKLRLEIAAIDRPIWKKPTFWAAIVPILVMLYGAGQLAITGYFDNQRTLIEIDRNDLEAEIETKRVELAKQAEETRKALEQMEIEFQAEMALLQKKQQAEREKLRQIGALGPVREAIAAMHNDDRSWEPYESRPMHQLIAQLRKEDRFRDDRTALVVKEFRRDDLEPEYRTAFA